VTGPAGGGEANAGDAGANAVAVAPPHADDNVNVAQPPAAAPQTGESPIVTQPPPTAPQTGQNGGGAPAATTIAGAPATCRQGPLYYASTGFPGMPNSIPVECRGPNPTEWASGLCSMLSETSNTQVCVDIGWGLNAQGLVETLRSPSALPVLTTSPAAGQGSGGSNPIHCQRGGFVGVTWDCGSVSVGTGGTIVPGVYVLTEYVRYGGESYPVLGAHVWQTLYLTCSSVLFISDDDNNFSFNGTYTYSVLANRITFTALVESSCSQYRAFPASATFRATPTGLELYDETRSVRETYLRIE
jgi:hypothetical protein